MYNLDIKDKKILTELDFNARQSNNEIGKKAGLSKEVVNYRINRLMREGILVKFYTVINYARLGIIKYKVYLQLSNVTAEKTEEICQYLKSRKTSEWLVRTTGKWDIIVGFLLHNVNELDDEILELTNKYSSFIRTRAITTTLHLVHHLREYLGSKKQYVTKSIVYHTSKDKQEQIDTMDYELLRLLANNARLPITEIARRLKTTARIIQYRMQQLEKKELILGYKCHLDPSAMGKIFCKGIFAISTATQSRLQQLMNYTSSIPESVWPQRVIGNWDFELDIEVENYDSSQAILIDIRNRFSDIIINTEFCITSKEYKFDLFPDAYPTFK
ncbi:MAG: Lrp/AsnC family transcriptional regulator [Candidatus Woesearchaeota archaeon]